MTNKPGLDFSFSGLKTHTLNTIEQLSDSNGELNDKDLTNIAHGFEEAVVQTIAIKCLRALQHSGSNTLVLAGGVAANKRLRAMLPEYLQKHVKNQSAVNIHYPAMKYCTDNGAMIAYAGYLRLDSDNNGADTSFAVNIKPRWNMTELI